MRSAHNVNVVREAERRLMDRLPEGTLMRRAATGLAIHCSRMLPRVYGSRVTLLVGGGDNGGDALYAGANLAARGAFVRAVAAGRRIHEDGAAALRARGGRILSGASEDGPTDQVRAALFDTEDNMVRIWDTFGPEPPAPAGPAWHHEAEVTHVSFSPDGAQVLTVSGRTARLWQVVSQPAGQTLRQPGDSRAIDISRDGCRLLAASYVLADRPGQRVYSLWNLKNGRRIGSALLLFVPLVLVLALAVGGVGWYARRSYYVGFADNRVVIYKGVPGGVLGWDPTIDERTELTLSQLSQLDRDRVAAGAARGSLGDAQRFVARLEANVAATSTTTTTTRPSRPTTTVRRAPPTTRAPGNAR